MESWDDGRTFLPILAGRQIAGLRQPCIQAVYRASSISKIPLQLFILSGAENTARCHFKAMLSINDLLNPSDDIHVSTSKQVGTDATDAPKIHSIPKSDDAHSEVVQNFRDLFRDATPFSLRGSIQERVEEIERDTAMQDALRRMSQLGPSGGGLPLVLTEDKELDHRIERNRAVVATMRELYENVRAQMQRRRSDIRKQRKRARAMEKREVLAAQAPEECKGPAAEERVKRPKKWDKKIDTHLVTRSWKARRTPRRDSI